MAKASKYLLTIPEFDPESEDWEEAHLRGGYRLSRSAVVKLRASIRAEQKEQSRTCSIMAQQHHRIDRRVIGLLAIILGHR
jgi:hypothetical protein